MGEAASRVGPVDECPLPSSVRRPLIGALGGLSSAFVAIQKASAGEDVGLLLPLISSTIALLCLAVLGYGLALAPKPETAKAAEAEAEAARIAQLTK